ncbi:Global transcription regulator sge1 [Fusarium piperis]|uniref:Global transcription regulator sge1 n=1 Tax=Fusarium piperis TaxID=1435070 RepID=A0A9W8W237_9HYPO|nr:Global transcription regulator sge1 [Fusarium piperis]
MSSTLLPTYVGYIHSTLDALIIFEACLSGARNHVPRRPQDRERQELIRSGNVFIYEEHASGIKRWTDGVSWSPSRILDNFLVYRELERPFGPGEKKRALKKPKKMSNGITKAEPRCETRDEDRALIGSLVDSYDFKQSGLVKKTISITFQGVPHHLVSYYTCEDVKSGRLTCPSSHPDLRNLIPRSELLMSQNFRAPIDGTDTTTDERYQSQVLVDYGYNTSMTQASCRQSTCNNNNSSITINITHINNHHHNTNNNSLCRQHTCSICNNNSSSNISNNISNNNNITTIHNHRHM